MIVVGMVLAVIGLLLINYEVKCEMKDLKKTG